MATQRKKRVFVVDDEHVIAQTLAIILEQNGFDAIAFTNPLKALEAAQTDAPDLVVSDVMMPEMSGIHLGIALRAQWPACKILLFSGQSATSDLLRSAREAGHQFELLSKPIHPTDLLTAIRSLSSDQSCIEAD